MAFTDIMNERIAKIDARIKKIDARIGILVKEKADADMDADFDPDAMNQLEEFEAEHEALADERDDLVAEMERYVKYLESHLRFTGAL